MRDPGRITDPLWAGFTCSVEVLLRRDRQMEMEMMEMGMMEMMEMRMMERQAKGMKT